MEDQLIPGLGQEEHEVRPEDVVTEEIKDIKSPGIVLRGPGSNLKMDGPWVVWGSNCDR